MNEANPLSSVAEWCDGVEHGPDRAPLYIALVMEEVSEMMRTCAPRGFSCSVHMPDIADTMRYLSTSIREMGADIPHDARGEALDAALDTAWVSLCLAYQLTGNDPAKLSSAWRELHRSNITDKQVGGVFVLDKTGKVRKPEGWTAPNFEAFLP